MSNQELQNFESKDLRTQAQKYGILGVESISQILSECILSQFDFEYLVAHIPTHGQILLNGATSFEFQGWISDLLLALPKLADSNKDPFGELLIRFKNSLTEIQYDKASFNTALIQTGCGLIFFQLLIGREYSKDEQRCLTQIYIRVKRLLESELSQKQKIEIQNLIKIQYDTFCENLDGGNGQRSFLDDQVNYLNKIKSNLTTKLAELNELFSDIQDVPFSQISVRLDTIKTKFFN